MRIILYHTQEERQFGNHEENHLSPEINLTGYVSRNRGMLKVCLGLKKGQ
jgi:hypothetical protein